MEISKENIKVQRSVFTKYANNLNRLLELEIESNNKQYVSLAYRKRATTKDQGLRRIDNKEDMRNKTSS